MFHTSAGWDDDLTVPGSTFHLNARLPPAHPQRDRQYLQIDARRVR
jgi:hypothetical protein